MKIGVKLLVNLLLHHYNQEFILMRVKLVIYAIQHMCCINLIKINVSVHHRSSHIVIIIITISYDYPGNYLK